MKRLKVVSITESAEYVRVKLSHPLAINSPVLLFKKEDISKVMNDIPQNERVRIKLHVLKDGHVARSIKGRFGATWEVLRTGKEKQK